MGLGTGRSPPRSWSFRRRILITVGATALLSLAWSFGSYYFDRLALQKDLASAIETERAALQQEELDILEDANAAPIWARLGDVLPPAMWVRVQAGERGNAAAVLNSSEGVFRLVDEALRREHCLFPLKSRTPGNGPFEPSAAFGPREQEQLLLEVPAILLVRARDRLERGDLGGTLADLERVTGVVRQGMERSYWGPNWVSEAFRETSEVLEGVLAHPDLTEATARRAASLPGAATLFRRDAQQRLHALQDDVLLYHLLRDMDSGRTAATYRQAFGLSSALPVLRFFPGDPGDIKAFRARRPRRLRDGMEDWPDEFPPSFLARYDLLRTASALRAYQLGKGRSAATLGDLVPDYVASEPADPYGTGPLSYKAEVHQWIVSSRAKTAPSVLVSSSNRAFECVWRDRPIDLSYSWPPEREASIAGSRER